MTKPEPSKPSRAELEAELKRLQQRESLYQATERAAYIGHKDIDLEPDNH